MGPIAKDGLILRPMARDFRLRALAIGISTGGPQALLRLFRAMETVPEVPVFIMHHLPLGFVSNVAESIGRSAGTLCRVPLHGQPVEDAVYLAPGGHHLRVAGQDGTLRFDLDDGPPVHHCRPAVDPMFDSLAGAFGIGLLAVVLTGMGRDGEQGARRVVAEGGAVAAQDAASSVVWGMPGAVALADICCTVADPEALGGWIATLPTW